MMRFDWTVTIDGVDVSSLVKAGGTIDYGTPAHLGGFQAPVAAFDMFTEEGNPQWEGSWPDLDLGMPVIIHVTWDGITQWRRFTGELSAIEHGAYQRSITATGTIAKLAHMWGGATTMFSPRPIEQDADRVEWLYPSFGFEPPLVIEATPARWLREIPGPQEDQPVLDQILRIADDADGNFQQDRLGVVRYRTRNFTTPPTVLIPEFITERESLNLVYDLTDVVNDVTIVFGEVHPLSDKRETYQRVADSGPVLIGVRKQILNTDLIWYEDAVGKAIQYLDQHMADWQLNDVTLLMNLCTGPVADDVLDLQIGWPVTIATLPPGAPMAEYDGQIIGTTEVMHQTDYRYILHLAPFVNAAEEPNQDPIYPDGIIEGWDSTGLVDGVGTEVGKQWRWCKWSDIGDSDITNSHDDMVWAQILAVAGGGGGSGATGTQGGGGGGGAGGLINLSILIGMGTQPVTIGAGGGAYVAGSDTYALGTTLYGGGYGGSPGSFDGGDGGSGGGAYFNRATHAFYGVPGEGVDGQGWPGYRGGGGATSQADTTSSFAGGAGLSSSIDGTPRVYGQGGEGAAGVSASGAANTGSGGAGGNFTVAPGVGGSGVFVVRYRVA